MNSGVIALFIPILALLIPIVAILVAHQQRMAQIIHQGHGAKGATEIDALRSEVRELKELLHQQSIAMDNLVTHQTKLPPPLEDRMNTGAG